MIEVILTQPITEEQYAELVEAGRRATCPQCGDAYLRAEGVAGPDSPTGNKYCSAGCVTRAERATAPMFKPQPKGVTIDNWAV